MACHPGRRGITSAMRSHRSYGRNLLALVGVQTVVKDNLRLAVKIKLRGSFLLPSTVDLHPQLGFGMHTIPILLAESRTFFDTHTHYRPLHYRHRPLIIFRHQATRRDRLIMATSTATLDLSQYVEENEFPIEAKGRICTSEDLVNDSLNKMRPKTAAHKIGGSHGTKETIDESDKSHSEDHSNSSQMSHSSYCSNSESHVENEERSRASDAHLSLQSPTKLKKITEEDMERLREELSKDLQEEQMLISLQMQLLLQLRKLKTAIQAAETEEALARLASQQAKVIRLLQYDDEENNVDDEVITIQVRY